jgi:ABC-type Fe3+ transport system permease subunit
VKQRGLCWLLLGLGAVACAATPAIDLLAGRGAGAYAGSTFLYIPLYLAGAFAFWKRPDHLAARRLLMLGSILVAFTAVGNLISVTHLVHGPFPWFWAANTFDQMLGTAFSAALIGLLAVFPTGRYERPYERWMVWLWVCLIPVSPVLGLFAHRILYVNHWIVWANPHVSSPVYVPALAWLAPYLGLTGD